MICLNCGAELINTNGVYKCESCEYQCEITTIDYTRQSNNTCMVCGDPLNDRWHNICDKCRDKMLSMWRKQNGNN